MIAVLWVIAVASVILNVVLFRMLDRSVGHRDDAVRLWKLSIKAARAATGSGATP